MLTSSPARRRPTAPALTASAARARDGHGHAQDRPRRGLRRMRRRRAVAVDGDVSMGVVMAVVVDVGTGHGKMLYYNITGVYKRGPCGLNRRRRAVWQTPSLRASGEGSGVGGISANSLPEEPAIEAANSPVQPQLSGIMPVQNVDDHAGLDRQFRALVLAPSMPSHPPPPTLASFARLDPAIRLRPEASADGGRGAQAPRMTSRSRRMFFARSFIFRRPSSNRGRRECRALDAPAASRTIKNKVHECSHHEYTGTTRHSPRDGFSGCSVLAPVRRACWPPSSARLHADLTPASGCQAHTALPSA